MRQRAGQRRRDANEALGAYVDAVAMRVASGSLVTEALRDAARHGTGFTFGRIRLALADAPLLGVSPARALGLAGAELRLPLLVELAEHLTLIDTSGAQAEESLRSKAESIRHRQLADTAGDAAANNETMLVALALLGLGFFLFLLYPLLASLLAV